MTQHRRDFLLVVALATVAAAPAFGQAPAPTTASANASKQSTVSTTSVSPS